MAATDDHAMRMNRTLAQQLTILLPEPGGGGGGGGGGEQGKGLNWLSVINGCKCMSINNSLRARSIRKTYQPTFFTYR